MSAKAQVKTQAKTPVAPAAARIPQPPVPEPEHVAERPDIAAQLEGAARLGHRLGAVGVDSLGPPIIQRPDIPEEEEEELQLKREPAAVQRQELPEEEEEELMLKPEEGRVGPQGGQAPPEVEAAIRRARGGGQPLACPLVEQMTDALGHDFSGVRVHTGPEADELNQQLGAKAVTTGRDLFFRSGAYEPGCSRGRELIAHELTHVVQQGEGRVGGVGKGMTVLPARDAFEKEAYVKARRAQMPGGTVAGGSWPDGRNVGVEAQGLGVRVAGQGEGHRVGAGPVRRRCGSRAGGQVIQRQLTEVEAGTEKEFKVLGPGAEKRGLDGYYARQAQPPGDKLWSTGFANCIGVAAAKTVGEKGECTTVVAHVVAASARNVVATLTGVMAGGGWRGVVGAGAAKEVITHVGEREYAGRGAEGAGLLAVGLGLRHAEGSLLEIGVRRGQEPYATVQPGRAVVGKTGKSFELL